MYWERKNEGETSIMNYEDAYTVNISTYRLLRRSDQSNGV